MLDIGWSEMAIIAVVALFVIGPRELPRMLRAIGHYAAKIRGMAREFQQGIDDAVRESELDEVKKQIESAQRIDVGKTIQDTVDPERRLDRAMDFSGAKTPARPGAAEEAPDAAAQPAAKAPVQGPAPAQDPAGAAQPPETPQAAAPPPEPPAGPAAEPEREAAAPPPRAAPRRAQGMASMAAAAAAPRKAAAPPAETETTGAGA